MYQKTLQSVFLACIICAISSSALAEPAPEDAFDYRVAVMTTLKGHIVAASMIVRGLVEDDGYLVNHALGLANGVAEIHRVFQEGSAVGETEALPAIWEQPEKFKAVMEKSEEATRNFHLVVAEGGDKDAIGAAFRSVGMSCRGCHDDFRVPH
ncbi:MAG: cytochrome c [Woeseia sp.]|nr:cytochrome c [Woeseia sp.]MBT8096773.1 cytochrome c [Woeseia sp.]NNE62123.1 cytochrome c [Woeseia sp.]NNL54049.1 cytochrome c [Woeseia sp.]